MASGTWFPPVDGCDCTPSVYCAACDAPTRHTCRKGNACRPELKADGTWAGRWDDAGWTCPHGERKLLT